MVSPLVGHMCVSQMVRAPILVDKVLMNRHTNRHRLVIMKEYGAQQTSKIHKIYHVCRGKSLAQNASFESL